jgi:hypothetical protein
MHPEDGGDTILRNSVLIRATRRYLPEDDNHDIKMDLREIEWDGMN